MHEVTLTKNLHEDVADSNAVHGDNNLVTQPQREIAKVLRNYVNTKDNKDKNTKLEQYMNKKLIRLTENDLHRIVKESVNKILKEYSNDYMNKEYYRLEKLYLEFGKIYKESKYTNDDGINGG